MVCKAIKFKLMERGYLPKVFIGSDHRVDMSMYVFCQKNFQTKRETFWISYAQNWITNIRLKLCNNDIETN